MKNEHDIEELLNAYLDGELSQRQQLEIQRMTEHDPSVAQRLDQLRKIKMLVSSLPVAEAPQGMVEDIMIALQKKQAAQTGSAARIAGYREMIFRKVLSAAALIALAAILGGIIFTIIAPGNDNVAVDWKQPQPVDNKGSVARDDSLNTPSEPVMPAGFYGTVEFKTADFAAVNGVINNTLKENSLADALKTPKLAEQGIYEITCGRSNLKELLTDLQGLWKKCDSTRLLVNTGDFAKDVEVRYPTFQQMIAVLEQNNYADLGRTAREFAMLNTINNSLSGVGIFSDVPIVYPDLSIPRPVLVTGERTSKTPVQPNGPKVTLIIRVLKNK